MMLEWIDYFFWKKRAKKAQALGKTTRCVACDDPIVPGDFVGICFVGNDPTEKLIHAGYHFSISKIDAFCDTGAVGSAVWNGTKALPILK
jgi:hypothetical protein